jgi:DHA1 family bicyclomycin/chloramphenicol resistance-like MFS transporter
MRPSHFNTDQEPQRATRRPPIFALIIVSALSPFAINSVVPSLPAIADAFEAEYGRVQLVLSLFLASVAVSQIFVGPLSDHFGRRPVLVAGTSLFVLATLLAPFSPTIETLIAIRVVMGATGCVGIVLGRAIVRDLFDRRQAASMLGYVTMGLAVAPMVAPVIGGLLQQAFGWTSIFWFMGLMGIGCVAVTLLYVPETNLHPTPRISFASMLSDFGQLVRSPDFLLFTANSGLTTGVFLAFIGGAPYVAEQILGLSPAVYGIWFGAGPVGYVVGNFLSGRFSERFGVARMILVGSVLALIAASLAPALFYAGYGGAPALFLPIVALGLANGIALPSSISGAVSVRPEIAGAASGLSGAAQIGTGAILSTAAGALLTGSGSAMPLFALMVTAAILALLVSFAIYPRNRPQ